MPLVDSDLWKSAFRALNVLRFHPTNPRLPELPSSASEKQIIAELCKKEDVESIARSITEKGYLRQDRLVVCVESGKHIVYEGNRRLCALKILSKPEKAPPSLQKTIRKLAERARLPLKIAIEIVPNKFDAEVVMYSKHALEKFQRDWKPLQQAAFVAGKVEDGENIEDIANAIGLKKEEVINAKAALDFYRLARLAPASAKAKKYVDEPSNFPYSTLFERIIVPKKVRQFIGVDFDRAGLIIKGDQTQFLNFLGSLLEEVAADNLTTRTVNTADEAIAYLRKFKYAPSDSSFRLEDVSALTVKDTEPDEDAPSPHSLKSAKKKAAKSSDKLFPGSLTCEHPREKLVDLVTEGKQLKLSYSYSAACLLRSTLEISLTVALKHHRQFHNVPASNPKHGPSLQDMIDFVKKNPASLNLDATEIGAIEALSSRKIKESKAQLDRIVHSPDALTSASEVRSLRESALPILAKALKLKP